jgi:hypothetical protein
VGGMRGMVLLPYVTGGAGGGLVELGVAGGLVLAASVKWGLKFTWRRMSAPRGRHQQVSGRPAQD